MKASLSFFHRFLTAIVGLIIGGLVGMLAFYLVMFVVGSDFGLDNVRPGILLGAAIGFFFGLNAQGEPREFSRAPDSNRLLGG